MSENTVRVADLLALRDAKRRHDAEVINTVLESVRRGDLDQFAGGLGQLDSVFNGWGRAMRAIARLNANPPDEFRHRMLQLWARDGDELRESVGDDVLLTGALRAILPVYRGPGLRLWRGDSAYNRRRRTYGLAWSRRSEVADGFARGGWRLFEGGSVLLEAEVPPEAVICVLEGSPYEEDEVLVDRRRLASVRVIARYGQLSFEEHSKQMLLDQLNQVPSWSQSTQCGVRQQ